MEDTKMEPWFQMVVTIVCAVVASSGFWAYIQKKSEKKDVRTQMLIGLAHDRIVYLGMSYIDRGWITQDEYENLHDYLYKPYEKMGGNGSAKKVMSEVHKLPIHKSTSVSYTHLYVIFSPKFENVINTNYLESKKTLKTVTLVAGEGQKIECQDFGFDEGEWFFSRVRLCGRCFIKGKFFSFYGIRN